MTSRTLETGRSPAEDPVLRKVKQSKDNATLMMKESGFDVGDAIRVRVDPPLPFMGYTMPQNDGAYTRVVAGNAVDSGMLEGLLVHEMSHVYRMSSHHPSHNGNIIESAVVSFGKEVAKFDYQEKIVYDILNDIQDLYADDIAFKVFLKGSLIPMDQLTSCLQSWVKDEPSRADSAKNGRMQRWVNGSILVHNARALAQMQRHRVPDTGNKAAEANKRFLSRLPPETTRNFGYFLNILEGLPENLTEDSYRKLLREYIGKFLETIGEA